MSDIEYVYIEKEVFDNIIELIKKYKETGDINWLKSLKYVEIKQMGSLSIDFPDQ